MAQFQSLLPFLRRNKLLTISVRKWIREQIAQDIESRKEYDDIILQNLNKWFMENSKGRLNFNESTNDEKKNLLELNYMDEYLLEEYAENEAKAIIWARKKWEDQVPQIYLEDKEKFNSATINTVSVPTDEKGIAFEIYYGLKEKEYSIDQTNELFGEKVKCTKGGGLSIKLDEAKEVMRKYIKSSKVGEITKPFRVDDRIVILEVLEYKEQELNKEIENKIIKDLLEKFIAVGIEQISDYLCTYNEDK